MVITTLIIVNDPGHSIRWNGISVRMGMLLVDDVQGTDGFISSIYGDIVGSLFVF